MLQTYQWHFVTDIRNLNFAFPRQNEYELNHYWIYISKLFHTNTSCPWQEFTAYIPWNRELIIVKKYREYSSLENTIASYFVSMLHLFIMSKNILVIMEKCTHDDVIKWKHFPRYWPFVQGIHRSPVNSLHKGQWHRALVFYLICARINLWVNSLEAGKLRRHRAHYDVIVMNL